MDNDNYTLESMKFKEGEAPNSSFGTQEVVDPPPVEDGVSEDKTDLKVDADTDDAKINNDNQEAEADNGEGASDKDDNGEAGEEKTGTAESGSASEETQAGTEKPKSFDELLVEQSGGTFKSMNEVTAEIKRLNENQRNEKDVLDTDLGEKFKAFREGRTGDADSIFKQFLNTQVQDFKEMDGNAILRYKMSMDNPTMSLDDVSFLVENNYKSDEDNDSEKEIRLGKLQREQDVTKTRKELIDMQANSALTPSTQSAQNGPTEAEIKEHNDAWDQSISASMKDFKSVEISIDDKGTKFSFDVDSKEISDAMSDPANFLKNRHVDKDGNVDMDGMRNEIAKIINLDKIALALSKNGVSLANEEHLNNRQNPASKDVGSGYSGETDKKSGDAGLADAMKATMNN